MLLSGALLALFMTGFWLYCLTDAILTPAAGCRGLSKRAWVIVIAVTFIGGAFAWLMARRPARDSARAVTLMARRRADGGPYAEYATASMRWTDADDAAARHPAGRAKVTGRLAPKGPDDDAEFLRVLEQEIRRNPPVS